MTLMRDLKWILRSLSLALFVSSTTWAAVPTLPAATAFYRSPQSVFTSGQTARSNLERKRVRTEYELSHQVKWDGKVYVLKADDLLRDLHCLGTATLKENSRLLDDRRSDAKTAGELPAGTEVTILQVRAHWARVKHQDREGWLPAHRLVARNEDAGVFVALIDTFLRDKPSNRSPIRTTLPRRTRLTAEEFTADGWIRVTVNGRQGYVDSHHLAGRADFAVWAWKKAGAWVLVSHREGTVVKGKNGETIPLADIIAYSPNAAKGIVTQIESAVLPPLRSHVEIVKTEATVWAVSDLDGHGEVWWKQNSLVMDDQKHDGEWLTTEQLLRRNVFSYALTGTAKIQGLVSADGVWKTVDGRRWTRLPDFGTQNLPVAIHPEAGWFVGSFRSPDQGKTFEPFIRWDALTRTIEENLRRPPRYVKLQKVEPLPSSRVQILVDTGVRRLSLRAHLLGNVWQISP